MDGSSGGPVARPTSARGRWSSFVTRDENARGGARALVEPDNDRHRVRVEFDGHTVFVHLSDENGGGWTTLAVDRGSRAWAVGQRDTQRDAAAAAARGLYADG